MDEEYNLCKEVCKKEGCYCPPSHEFHSVVANTPMFIRAYFHAKGYYKALDDNHILYGEDAKRFIEMVENPPPMTKEQEKFLKECEDIIKNNPQLKLDKGDRDE